MADRAPRRRVRRRRPLPLVLFAVSLATMTAPRSKSIAQDLPPVLQTLDSQWTIALDPAFDRNRPRIGVPVPLGLYVVARDDFADVRILSVDTATKSAVEIPYELLRPGDPNVRRELPASLSKPVHLAEGTQYVLDLGGNPPAVDEIVVDVASDTHDYHGSVRVFGYDVEGQETGLTQSGLLYDTKSPARTIRICRIDFPVSRFRYYRVVISDASGSQLPVAAIRAVERVERQPAGIELSSVKMSWAFDASTRSSIVEADLNYRHLPTNGVKLDVNYGGGDYCRAARVEVTDLSEGAASWKHAATFELYRLTQGDGTQVECSSVEYPSAYGGYVRVVIDNGDQPPLTVNELTAISIPELLVCDQRPFLEPARQIALYAGDLQRTSPVPPTRTTAQESDAEGLSGGIVVGPRTANPYKLATYDPRVIASDHTQNLTWWSTVGVLFFVCSIIAMMIWRSASRAGSSDAS